MTRVVITGLGWTNSLGRTVGECWSRLLDGHSGVAPIKGWDVTGYSAKVAAPAASANTDDEPALSTLRMSARLYLAAVNEAFHNAGLDRTSIRPHRLGSAIGISVNYIDHQSLAKQFCSWDKEAQALDLDGIERQHGRCSGFYDRRVNDSLQTLVSSKFKVNGPAILADTACAASAHATGHAFRLIQRGKADAMLTGGTCALVNPAGILAFALLGALSKCADPAQASRPFDRDRDGFVMGEAAGVMVLESLESARRRGAPIYAEMVGYAATTSGGSLTDPEPTGTAQAQAMRLALSDASLDPSQVDYVAAHGTSTQKNDSTETLAIRSALGKRAAHVPVTSIKGNLGHTISAAAVSNLICATKAITDGRLPATINLKNPDRDCDLDYVPNVSRKHGVRVALANAFAFGGQNTCFALRAWEGFGIGNGASS